MADNLRLLLIWLPLANKFSLPISHDWCLTYIMLNWKKYSAASGEHHSAAPTISKIAVCFLILIWKKSWNNTDHLKLCNTSHITKHVYRLLFYLSFTETHLERRRQILSPITCLCVINYSFSRHWLSSTLTVPFAREIYELLGMNPAPIES